MFALMRKMKPVAVMIPVMPVQAIIKPLLDVPSAFTPGKFGVNGIVKVKGFGITKMHWIIYNRWGQNVFESTSIKLDGMEYLKVNYNLWMFMHIPLDVIFSDGKNLEKPGI